MGAEPWSYFVPYESNIQSAVDRLRQSEFRAGRFRYAEEGPSTIEEAIEIADADGTASILDIERVADDPDFGVVAPLADAELKRYFGTATPDHRTVEENLELFEEIDRGHGRYVVVYDGDRPSELFFAGYSYD
jgi:hypothetical protein